MIISTGIIQSAQKIVVYGPEGIGKSTFASCFPNPLFIDTEGSTKHLCVSRTPRPSSWSMLMEQIRYIKAHSDLCGTLILDTADWAEMLCSNEVCAKAQKSSIEDFGYGKGYIYLAEEFGRMLNLLEEIVELGTNVVVTAHAKMRKFEQPDEMGAYDRWELKLQKQTAPLLKEWADMVLFANYKTYVVNVDGKGTEKGKNKAQGGSRVMYTTHHPCWDAKNRHNLKPELKFEYSEIASYVSDRKIDQVCPFPAPPSNKSDKLDTIIDDTPPPVASTPQKSKELSAKTFDAGIPKSLLDLMTENFVDEIEIQKAVSSKGYYPEGTPIKNYDSSFIDGVLVAAWPQVYQMICDIRAANDEKF